MVVVDPGNLHLEFGQNWVSSSCDILVVIVVVVIVVVDVDVLAHVVYVDPRNQSIKFCKKRISNSWDIDDVEFGGGGWWCKVIFMSNPTFVRLG